jgi:hypothetical protein
MTRPLLETTSGRFKHGALLSTKAKTPVSRLKNSVLPLAVIENLHAAWGLLLNPGIPCLRLPCFSALHLSAVPQEVEAIFIEAEVLVPAYAVPEQPDLSTASPSTSSLRPGFRQIWVFFVLQEPTKNSCRLHLRSQHFRTADRR